MSSKYPDSIIREVMLYYLDGHTLREASVKFNIPLDTLKGWRDRAKWASLRAKKKKELEEETLHIYDFIAKREIFNFLEQYTTLNTRLFSKVIQILDSNVEVCDAKSAKAFIDAYLKTTKDLQDLLRIQGAKAEVELTDNVKTININTDIPLNLIGSSKEEEEDDE